MDTRSVVRSRRRSTRLTGQSPQDERVQQPAASKRRASSHDTSPRPKHDASREARRLEKGSNSKNPSLIQKARSETPESFATKNLTRNKDKGIIFPLIPNLNPSRTLSPLGTRTTAASDAFPSKVSDDVAKDHVSKKWVKTARGSVRLASDPPADKTNHSHDWQDGDEEKGQEAQVAVVRRRSSRLASMTPDVEDVAETTSQGEPIPPRTKTKKGQALNTAASTMSSLGSCPKKDVPLSLQDTSTRATPGQARTATTGHPSQLPFGDRRSQQLIQEDRELIEDTSPIPELVADIERIILSSPVPNEDAGDARSQNTIPPTLPQGHASVIDRSSTLRSSKSSDENKHKKSLLSNSETLVDTEQTDSESSQVDGAFDDSIRRNKQKQPQAARPTASKSRPSGSRGKKRRNEELSQDEGDADTTRVRRRRQPDSDESKREVDLSSASPIDIATSRNSFSVDDSSHQSSLDVGESARRTGEPVNPVLLAQMLNTHPERMDSAAAASAPSDDGYLAASQPQALEESLKCVDCGRAPKSYLVCANCQQAVYCGKYCQIWNWPIHKTRCHASDEADQAEVEMQEVYLRDMWSAGVRMLQVEEEAGGTLESVLLEEAVGHSRTRPRFMGRDSARGFAGSGFHVSQSASLGGQSMETTHAMSVRSAKAAQGSEEGAQ
ncbi:hypothetical protein Daus18300_005759 [Diaporthe australafricana]|uniref:MYND-type domain-containing protein n=1 Tax=Diaporthe australafricana TaxID=127596 RepID=A0ABR3WYZ9_9PEZI